MPFIDHESQTVWNGSNLDRNLSANLFNDWWNNRSKPELKIQDIPIPKTNTLDDLPANNLFELISQEHSPNADIGLSACYPKHEEKISKRNNLLKR